MEHNPLDPVRAEYMELGAALSGLAEAIRDRDGQTSRANRLYTAIRDVVTAMRTVPDSDERHLVGLADDFERVGRNRRIELAHRLAQADCLAEGARSKGMAEAP